MMTPLGNVAIVSTGFPFRKKVESEEGGDVALVQIRDADVAEGALSAGGVVLRSAGATYDRYLLQPGDLLFQSRGSRHPVALLNAPVRGIAGSGLHVIRPRPSAVLPEYLAWWLNHPDSQATFKNQLSRGTNVPFVSKAALEAFEVPVPPLNLQRRIVEVYRLRRQERELLERLDRLTQQLVDGATLAAARRTT